MKFFFYILVVGTAASSVAMAEGISADQYQSLQKNIASEFNTINLACNLLVGNTYDICKVQAKANRDVAKAALENEYRPSIKNKYLLDAAKINAEFAVSFVICDGKTGSEKDACMNSAIEVKDSAVVDANNRVKISWHNTYRISGQWKVNEPERFLTKE